MERRKETKRQRRGGIGCDAQIGTSVQKCELDRRDRDSWSESSSSVKHGGTAADSLGDRGRHTGLSQKLHSIKLGPTRVSSVCLFLSKLI